MTKLIHVSDILENASQHLEDLSGHIFDVLSLSKPATIENAIFGCSRIIGPQIVTGASVAKARDDHYHNTGFELRGVDYE